jgi:rfaE bifunctional protein kinase chain/domain/rfaE bifunctional protein nucleotidyltransferase chain/domain
MIIKLLNEKILNKIKKAKKKIVLCHGVFDLFHIGHLNHINEAKTLGDILIVSVTTDKYVNKGPDRPFFTTKQRLDLLSSIKNIDYVIQSNSPSGVEIINKIKPNIYFKGPDYLNHNDDFTGLIKKELHAVEKNNGKIAYSTSQTFSSSSLLNKIIDFSEDQRKIIKSIKKMFTFKKISSVLKQKTKKLRILIIGEMIIDRFIFCDALGKSGKEAILNLEKKFEKEYIGGVGAIGNHLSDFGKKINVISYLGDYKDKKKFIFNSLKSNVSLDFIIKKSSPTITKSKIIDTSNNSKLLGLYEFNDMKLTKSEEKNLSNKIKKKINNFDIIIVSDYGHSFINQQTANSLAKNKKVIVNTQLNSANLGYHTIGKYKNCNWAIINEVELRHELRNRHDGIKKLMVKLTKKLKIKNLIVTCGKHGAYYYENKSKKFIYCPAFAKNIVDKIGSGDAFMSIFSIINKCFPKNIELSLFISSLATSQVLEDFGNVNVINQNNLLKAIKYILK